MKYTEVLNIAKSFNAKTGIVLGSGLGPLVEEIDIEQTIHYQTIEGFPQSTVEGHAGNFVLGRLDGIRVIAAQGRFHYYEGYSLDELLSIVRFFNEAGVKHVIITNAAGLMNVQYSEGDILAITDCIDFTKKASETGSVNSAKIRQEEQFLIELARTQSGVMIGEGVYVWTTGPSFETPAEIRYMTSIGGDVVGMSTMPELIYAREHGMDVFPFSVATNFAAGISKNVLTHEEVKETADRIREPFIKYIRTLIKVIHDKYDINN